MSDYRLKSPGFLWGPAFAYFMRAGYPLDNVVAGDEPRAGFETVQSPSGLEDSWDAGTDYVLEGDLRWIPKDATVSPSATGWDDVAGVREFLAWGQRKNVIRFCPDGDDPATYIECYLVEPMTLSSEREPDGTRKVRIKLRNATTAFDGY